MCGRGRQTGVLSDRTARLNEDAHSAFIGWRSGRTAAAAAGAAAIGDEGKATISGAAAIVAAEGGNVAITGHTDKTGDAAADEQLAKQRALAVRDALMATGVAESGVVMLPPMSVTGAVKGREARRVDITRR